MTRTISITVSLVGLLAGCVNSNVVQCDDGQFCPASTECAMTTAGTFCVEPDRTVACAGKAENDACGTAATPGTCHGGACFDDVCGNALSDATEVCDDGNDIADDQCSLDCQSTNVCGNQLVDAPTDEECDLGDKLDHDGCSSDCRIESARWELVNTEHPGKRGETALVYDANRRRVVLFGGVDSTTAKRLDDTWEWDGLVWSRRSSIVTPTVRSGHQMVYDAAREEVVLFSGRSSPADTWIWNGAGWSLRGLAVAPRQRNGGAMVYDSLRSRTLLFGGEDNGTVLADTWQWDGVAWTKLELTTAPEARAEASIGYDAKRGVIVLFGGRNATQKLGDTWEFDGTAWAQKSTTGPAARSHAAMAFEPTSGRVVVIDGEGPSAFLHDAWAWDGSQWQSFDTTPGASVQKAAMTTDPVRGRLVLFDTTANLYERSSSWVTSSTGSFNPGVPATPQERTGHVLVLDSSRRQLVLFGGADHYYDSFSTLYGDTWVWNGQWTRAATTGPSARMGAAAAFDPIRNEVVLFGGCDDAQGPALADTWAWSGSSWGTRSGGPGARCFAHMAFDKKRGRIILHGGSNNGAALDDTWSWDGSSWQLASSGLARFQAAFGYDEERERIVLFGGVAANNQVSAETWLWDGTAWTNANVPGVPGRKLAAMAWDRGRRRLVMYGGEYVQKSAPDAWEWTGTAWELLTTTAAGAREMHAMASAPDGAGVFVYAGIPYDVSAEENLVDNGLWRLRWDGASSTERCGGTDADGDGALGCQDPDCAAVCSSCGNGMCEAGLEQCTSCPADCGACAASCGDFVCATGETCTGDCP